MDKAQELAIIDELADIECQLSPEWLTCDGELSPAEVRRKAKALYRRQAALWARLGRKPTWQELQQAHDR